MMSDSIPQPSFTPRDNPRWLAWLVGIVVGTALAVIVAVQLPDRAKLLGLFPLLWGALAGLGYGWWALECRLRLPRWCYVLAFLLIAAGEAGIVYRTWQQYQVELRQQFARDPAAGMAQQAEKVPIATGNPEQVQLRQHLLAELERVKQLRGELLKLPAFLRRRLRKLGYFPDPWPQLFYAGEILFGSLAGLAALRFSQPPPRKFSPESPPV